MHNYAIFAKYLGICKHFGKNLTNEKGNEPRRGVVPRFSDLEVIALSLAVESIGIDSENYLFAKLSEYQLECPYRLNQKNWRPTFIPFAKARKRIETVFSQMCGQYMLERNYAKETTGLFTRIIGKISALTFLQYINYTNNRPIGRVKYTLFLIPPTGYSYMYQQTVLTILN